MFFYYPLFLVQGVFCVIIDAQGTSTSSLTAKSPPATTVTRGGLATYTNIARQRKGKDGNLPPDIRGFIPSTYRFLHFWFICFSSSFLRREGNRGADSISKKNNGWQQSGGGDGPAYHNCICMVGSFQEVQTVWLFFRMAAEEQERGTDGPLIYETGSGNMNVKVVVLSDSLHLAHLTW